VPWVTGGVWHWILARVEFPHGPIGQNRHCFAVLVLEQHKPFNWIQRQMGHRTLQMLSKHHCRWIPRTVFLSEESLRWNAHDRQSIASPLAKRSLNVLAGRSAARPSVTSKSAESSHI